MFGTQSKRDIAMEWQAQFPILRPSIHARRANLTVKFQDLYGFTVEGNVDDVNVLNEVREKVRQQGRVWWALEASKGANWYLMPQVSSISEGIVLKSSLKLSAFANAITLKKLIRKGIPPVLRPKVWFSLSGAAKKKSTVPESYCFVRYGRSRFPLTHEATGYSLVYNQLYPFEGLQNYTSGIIHHVRLTGLKPSTIYYYRCGDPTISAMSDIYHFRTMPESGPRSYPKRIAVVGDLGLTYNTTDTISHLTMNKPDLVLLVGDVTYANLYLTNGTGSDCYDCSFPHTPIHETYQPRWDYWGRFMQSLISKTPIMVVEGNHEIEEQAGNQKFVAYSSRFAFPSKESKSSSTFYYSFNAGGIHFIMIGAYVDYSKSAKQYKWLEADLANVDRSITPWLVAVWHPPWYSSYKAHYKEAECLRVAMEELLYSYGVDIVFNGHVHAYERSNRVYNYTLDPCGPVYITVGDGGNREKMAIEHADEAGNCPDPSSTYDVSMGGFCATNFTSGPAAGKFCWDCQPDYSAFRESSFGHGILEVKNETWALWTWYRNQDSNSKVGDQIYIVRQPDMCPALITLPKSLFADS